ncbi:AraC family transcriptional regulator [Polaromonas sp.]|uniref:helix-turn-helix domain-containing protein n=1 Tax=Polaromonas sp. TaxID=1869339 RepID=UPI001D4B4409|nr:AraC family transcriptional regulator [Polaromonas sp.]MBT9475199.1 helix-turn-helix transcriptional regulator [Polaromonas sp.]
MQEICDTENARIASGADFSHVRSIAARRIDPAFEVRVQDVHWPCGGQSLVQTGARCTVELLIDEPTGQAAHYTVAGERGARSTVGRLNFVAPMTSLDMQWSRGQVRSIVCMFDPVSLGLLDSAFWDWRGVNPLAALDLRNDRLETTMGWLYQELRQPSFASQLQITTMLTMLALETQRHFGARPPDIGAGMGMGKLSARQLAVVKDLIEQALPDGVPLQALAAACGLPSRELPAMFRNTVGVTLRSFVASAHIAKAKLLLSDSRLLIKQVAGRSGFESASAFTAAFRKATGMRPQQYRESSGMLAAQPESSGE